MLPISYENPTMPIGISPPTVQFLTPVPPEPEDWSQEVAGYYYVDSVNGLVYDREGGVNYTREYGTPSKPRQTLPTIVPAGSIVYVIGDYQYSTNKATYNIHLGGTADEFIAGVQGPVFFTSYGEEKANILNRGIGFSGSNFFIDNIQFEVKVQFGSQNPTADWSVRNSVMRYCNVKYNTTSIIGSALTECSHLILYDNEMSEGGDIYGTLDTDVTGVQIQENVNNIWVLKNHIHHMQGAGVQTLGNQDTTLRIFAGWNHIHHCRQNGLWLKAGYHVVYSTNHVHDIFTTFGVVTGLSQSPSKGIGGQYTPSDYWIINNLIHDVSYGMRFSGYYDTCKDPSVHIIGNIIHSISPQGDPVNGDQMLPDNPWGVCGINLLSSEFRYVYNNVILNTSFPIKAAVHNTGKNYIRNNILMTVPYVDENGITKEGANYFSETSSLGTLHWLDSNYFGETMRVSFSKVITTEPSQLGTGATGNLTGPTLFDIEELVAALDAKDLSGFDLTPLEDKGTDVTDILIDKFKSSFPDSNGLMEDYLGKSRVQGLKQDIGTFEAGDIYVENTPSTPTLVNIDVVNQAIIWQKAQGNFVYDIYKNQELLIEGIEPSLGIYSIPTISESVDSYTIVARNSVGIAVSETIESMVITIENFLNNEDVSVYSSYFIPRQGVSKKGNFNYSQVSSNVDIYGLPNERVKFSLGGDSLTGGVYFEAGDENYMEGSITCHGEGIVNIVTTCGAFSDNPLSSALYINNNVILNPLIGGFHVTSATVSFKDSLDYKITSKDYHSGFLGIASLVERGFIVDVLEEE